MRLSVFLIILTDARILHLIRPPSPATFDTFPSGGRLIYFSPPGKQLS